MSKPRILVVDDELTIREMVCTALELADFEVDSAANAKIAFEKILDDKPDLLLVDWMMPDISGIELVRRLKRNEVTAEVPIIMLTAKTNEDARIDGLNSGADDYIAKPFSVKEMVARVNAILRRVMRENNKLFKFKAMELDADNKRITISGHHVAMGPTEFKLMEFFMMHPDRVYSRTQLLDYVWGSNVFIEDRTVDVHIRRLRKALSDTGYEKTIQTVRGSGYRFSTQN